MMLLHHVWQESHEARALDGVRELALVPGTHARAFAWNDLSEGRQVALQIIGVLVIYSFGVHAAEQTLSRGWFCHWHTLQNRKIKKECLQHEFLDLRYRDQ